MAAALSVKLFFLYYRQDNKNNRQIIYVHYSEWATGKQWISIILTAESSNKIQMPFKSKVKWCSYNQRYKCLFRNTCVNVLLSLFSISNVHLKYFKRLLSFVNTKSDLYLLITMLLNLSVCPFNGHGSTLKLSTSTISTGTLVKGVLAFEKKWLYVRNLSLWQLFP